MTSPSLPGRLQEDRRKNAGGEALEAKRAIELFLGIHVHERMAEDVGDAPHVGEQRVRPRPFAANGPEAQSSEQFAADEHRHRHVRLETDALPVRAIERSLRAGKSSRRAYTTGLSALNNDHAQGHDSGPEAMRGVSSTPGTA